MSRGPNSERESLIPIAQVGADTQLGESRVQEGLKMAIPTHFAQPKPVAIPFASTAGDPASKGAKQGKPPDLSSPKPVAIPSGHGTKGNPLKK